MEYRGIITQGYHVDAGGQTPIRIITRGYVGGLAAIREILNIVERTAYFAGTLSRAVLFGKTVSEDADFAATNPREIWF